MKPSRLARGTFFFKIFGSKEVRKVGQCLEESVCVLDGETVSFFVLDKEAWMYSNADGKESCPR